MTERNRMNSNYSWSTDEEQEMYNIEVNNRFELPASLNTSPVTAGSSGQPSTSGQSSRNSMMEALSAHQYTTDNNVSLHSLSTRTRMEADNPNRHHNKLTLRNRIHGSNRLSTQHRTPTRSTSLAAEGRQNMNNHHIKKMLILRKAALVDRRYWTSILKNNSTQRKNLIPSTSGTRYTRMRKNLNNSVASRTDLTIELQRQNSSQSTSTTNPRTSHGNRFPPTASQNLANEEHAPNQQLSSTLNTRTHLSSCFCDNSGHFRSSLSQPDDDLSEDRICEVHATPTHAMSGDLSLEEEVIEVVADDVNDSVITNMNEQNTTEVHNINDVTALRTEQSANKSGRSRLQDTTEHTKVSEINQSLLRLLECPVCLEFMEPPMSQCRRGHLVCSSCRGRIISCPICRTAFSSVRNRAMESVSEIVRYPCRHGCGRETRLRRRETHEANCANRTYSCPVVSCTEHSRYPHSELQLHYQDKHSSLLRQGETQTFTLKLNQEHNEQWLLKAFNELFHVGIDITMNSWSLFLYVIYVGPKRKARNYTYEVTVVGNYNNRKMVYSRMTHSDLENNSFNVGRHDCFYLSLDQAMNYIRFKNKYCDPKGELNIKLSLLCDNTEAHDNSDICVD